MTTQRFARLSDSKLSQLAHEWKRNQYAYSRMRNAAGVGRSERMLRAIYREQDKRKRAQAGRTT